MIDTGCQCLVALARLQQVPAEYSQLRHQFGDGEQPLSDNALLRAGKALGFKARKVSSSLSDLNSSILPAIAKSNDGRCFFIGNNRFIDEIEQRIGIRVEKRGRGRLRNEEK